MRRQLMAGAFLMAAGFTAPSVVAAPTSELITEYHIVELSRTLLFHEGHIVAGRTNFKSGGRNAVEFISPDSLTVQHRIEVDHSMRGISAKSSCEVMAYGTSGYTVIDICDRPMTSRSYSFGSGFVPMLAGVGNSDYYVFSEPTSGMYLYQNGRRARRIGDNVSYGVSMETINGDLWVPNYFKITVLDASTGDIQSEIDTGKDSYGWKYVKSVGDYVVGTIRDDQKIAVIDPAERSVVRVLDVDGEPEGIATLGQCAVVADSLNKRVWFVKVAGADTEIVATWDAGGAGDKLKYPALVAVDAAAQAVYLRSSYPCPSCSVTQSSMFKITDAESDAFASCM